MRHFFIKKWKKFYRQEAGVFSVEFAFAVPILALMIFGTIEIGMIMFTQSLMEGALRDASRYGITGQITDNNARLTQIEEIISTRTLGLVDMEQAKIEILTYPSFSRIGEGEPYLDGDGNGQYDVGETYTDENGNGIWDEDIGVSGPGDADDVVLYRIRYDWPLMIKFMQDYIGTDGRLPLVASIAVRNEPWNFVE